MADVVVFVDRAVQGHLPGVCVIDGIDTTDVLVVRRGVGDGAGLGVAWLLVLAGPIGWIGLLLIASFRPGRSEVLTVQLPYSPEAYTRLRAERRRGWIGWSLVAAALAVGLMPALTDMWATVADLRIGAALVLAVAGLIGVAQSALLGRKLTVGVELDASRRWVTLRSVHPRFAALATSDDTRRSVG